MKGIWIGSLLAAVVMFVWGFVFWGILPVSKNMMSSPPEALVQELRALPSSGVYMVPSMDLYESNEEEFNRQHEAGPIVMIQFRKEGATPGAPGTMGLGFLHMLASALLIAFVLRSVAAAMPGFGTRVLFVLVAGSAGAFLADISPIIWWLQPASMHVANFAYHVVGWLLMGLVLARFVRPPATA